MSVVVMLGGDSKDLKSAITSAIALSKRLKTTLTGLCALPDPASAMMYITGADAIMVGSSALDSLSEAQAQTAKDYEAFFANETQKEAWLKTKFVKRIGPIATHAVAEGLLAEALVLPASASHSTHPLNAAFEHLLMESHLPVVLAPSIEQESDTCLIAWDGSPLAARSVKLHLPLIATYNRVVLAQNPEKLRHQWSDTSNESHAELRKLLERQRLDVVVDTLSGDVSEAILASAKKHDASMIIMGAYGHMRIGEMLFGGTTRDLLQTKTAPALALCH